MVKFENDRVEFQFVVFVGFWYLSMLNQKGYNEYSNGNFYVRYNYGISGLYFSFLCGYIVFIVGENEYVCQIGADYQGNVIKGLCKVEVLSGVFFGLQDGYIRIGGCF